MASLIENLIKVLEKEEMHYKQLLDLSIEKTNVIVTADIDRLQDIISKEQELIDKINVFEKQREENISDIANVLNISREDLKLDKLTKLLEKQPKEHDALVKVHNKFKKTMEHLVQINEHNKLLLKESVDMLEFELNIARSAMMAPETANYSKEAFNTMGQIQTSGSFDAKQ